MTKEIMDAVEKLSRNLRFKTTKKEREQIQAVLERARKKCQK